ncbi:MAG: phosphatidylserine/phosphatidylglycerophosphate/cardiolipin synthase family protein [Bdellovibrionota bacterium]
MMKARFYFLLSFLFSLTVVASASGASRESDPPVEKLIRYYKSVSRGFISPSGDGSFVPGNDQDFFTIDVFGWNRFHGSIDFIEGKRSFYKSLDFEVKKQFHKPPYYFHSSWGTLFHPPIKKLTLPIQEYVAQFGGLDLSQSQSKYFDPSFQAYLDKISQTELTAGNELELLPNGRSFQEKLRLVRDSKRYFFGTVMVYFCDESTRLLMDEMIRARKRGVDVRIMVEGLYASTAAKSCMNRMRDGGIDAVLVSDFYKTGSLFGVMHHKFWIRDGEEAIIGGQNMHEFSNRSSGFNFRTRDTDVHIKRGPIVSDLMCGYLRLWSKYSRARNQPIQKYRYELNRKLIEERSQGFRGKQLYPQWLSNSETRARGVCRVLVQSAGAQSEAIAPVVAEYMKAAQEHILLTTPSLDYDGKFKGKMHWEDAMAWLLKLRADKGVRVDVISNGLTGGMGDATTFLRKIELGLEAQDLTKLSKFIKDFNLLISKGAAKSKRENLLDLASRSPRIRTWTYFNHIHAKQYFFDRIAVMVGSFNFDRNSTEKNHESALFCLDQNLRDQMEAQFALDLVNSVPVVSKNGQ